MECELVNGCGHRLTQGGFAIVPKQAGHIYNGLSDDCELLVIDISNDDPLIRVIEQSSDISLYDDWLNTPRFSRITPETAPLLEFTSKRLQQLNGHSSASLNCQLLPLLLLQLCDEEPGLPDSGTLKDTALWRERLDVHQLNKVIDKHLSQPLNNQQLADSFYLSQSHFYSLFQRQFSMTPQQYVLARRLHKGQELLLGTSLPQVAIAMEVGFSDASSFSKAYKKYFGQTPGLSRQRG
jgi:AraC-like DNA-binding protein